MISSAKFLLCLALASLHGYAIEAENPEAGQSSFRQCAQCHSLQPGIVKTGPSLAGLFGRPAGSIPDFPYSDAMHNAKIVWTEETLRRYLHNPKEFLPGNRMAFSGISDQGKLDELIDYLKIATEPPSKGV